MRIWVGLAAAALCCGFVWADKGDEPPVATQKVNAQYPPEMETSYVLDTVAVRMTVAPDGTPFELNAVAPLPDIVVHALSQWRFEPGTHGGQPAAYAVGLSVPVRRPITRAVELSLRRRWTTSNKETKDAIKAGSGLDAAGAAQLEQGLEESPASVPSRITLLAYFASAPAANNSEATSKARADQIAWLAEKLPDSPILDSPLVLINAAGGPLADQSGYQRVRDLWLRNLSLDADKPAVLAHGTNFLRVSDPEKTEQFLNGAKSKDASIWLGDLYGLTVLGVTSLDLNTGLPATTGAQVPDAPFARKARAALRSTDDARVLLSALAVVTSGGRSLAKAGHLPDGYSAFCQELIDHAKKIHPATLASCDTSASEAEINAPLRIRVGGNVQQAKLIRQPPPTYPPDARSRRIQGTVRFQATIDKKGEISELEFLRGPLVFYEETRKTLSRWKYQPTLLNGEPVEILTQIDVNYTLSR
jgi:TonB family protein